MVVAVVVVVVVVVGFDQLRSYPLHLSEAGTTGNGKHAPGTNQENTF